MRGFRVSFSHGGTVEIIIRDDSGRKEDKFIFNRSDKEHAMMIAKALKDKYDIDLSHSGKIFDY